MTNNIIKAMNSVCQCDEECFVFSYRNENTVRVFCENIDMDCVIKPLADNLCDAKISIKRINPAMLEFEINQN